MSEQSKPVVAKDNAGALTQLVRTLRLVWRLLKDSRVPVWPKLIIPAAILYVLSPIDIIPDFILGLGQLDDLGIVALALAMFIEFCPSEIVEEHRRAISGGSAPPAADEEVIEGSYHHVPDDDKR
jgi:uncharacterized membrane protein YkvA (DUF1232 family)